MKNNDEKCVLVPKKEYQELLRIKEQKESAPIKIGIIHYIDYNGCNISTSGEIDLSKKLLEQVRAISCSIMRKNKDSIKEYYRKQYYNEELNLKREMAKQFADLPWYKRLFYKSPYYGVKL